MGWAKKLGTKVLGMAYNADSAPWCGLLVAQCIAEAGQKPTPIAVCAKAWATWGVAVTPPPVSLVFERPGSGHVAFYSSEYAPHYRVLGGNQGDALSIMRIAKNRMVASRWPVGVAVTTKPMQMAASGAPASGNEA